MQNPIIHTVAGDPFVLSDCGRYYLVCTNSGGWHATTFDCYESRDLIHWSAPSQILNLADVSWARDMAWGPCLLKKDGNYYFAYAADQTIGIAVCEEPMGQYRDILNRPVIDRGEYGAQTIEPCLFDDGGRVWLIWGQGRCMMQEVELSPTGVCRVGDAICLSDEFYYQRSQSPDVFDVSLYNESPDLVKWNGRYLLTWTVYDVRDIRYRVRYAWSECVTGPYIMPMDGEDGNLALSGKGAIQGTGGQCVFHGADGLYMAYHRRSQPFLNTKRELCCDKVEFLDDFHIRVCPT